MIYSDIQQLENKNFKHILLYNQCYHHNRVITYNILLIGVQRCLGISPITIFKIFCRLKTILSIFYEKKI